MGNSVCTVWMLNRYIIREKRTTPDGDTFWYMLAENALDEIGKDNIKAFVKQVNHRAVCLAGSPKEFRVPESRVRTDRLPVLSDCGSSRR